MTTENDEALARRFSAAMWGEVRRLLAARTTTDQTTTPKETQ